MQLMGIGDYARRMAGRAVRRGVRGATRIALEQIDKTSQRRGGPAIPIPDELRRKPRADRSRAKGPIVEGEVVSDYPGDYAARVNPEYSPDPDGHPDPGEIVWGWVPFEEDFSRGKDRPVLVIGHDGEWLLALMLTSRDHIAPSRNGLRAEHGNYWFDIGSGPWDRRGRPSEIRLDRVIRLQESAIRREGAVMPRATFDDVVRAMQHSRFSDPR